MEQSRTIVESFKRLKEFTIDQFTTKNDAFLHSFIQCQFIKLLYAKYSLKPVIANSQQSLGTFFFSVRFFSAVFGFFRHCSALFGTFRHCLALYGTLRHFTALSGTFRHVSVRSGVFRHLVKKHISASWDMAFRRAWGGHQAAKKLKAFRELECITTTFQIVTFKYEK